MSFAVVGIGASAGGLEAFEQFFSALTSPLGVAFVLVQHLEPSHPSMLSGLLSNWTDLPISEAQDGVDILADHIYVIPPGQYLTISEGKLYTLAREVNERSLRLPIDVFFRSLAQECGMDCAGIVLSGSGSDGALGLAEIHAAGGLTMVQSPSTAAFEDMPRNALETGLIDQALQIRDMPGYLLKYFSRSQGETSAERPVSAKALNPKARTLDILRDHTGHDFSGYKPSTIERRIERRMLVNQIQSEEDYLVFLERHPGEQERLHRELLIGVTSFFRDHEPFEVLESTALASIINDSRPVGQPIRFWVAGCSTGEEVYSLAMLAQEHLENCQNRPKLTIFASDIDTSALEKAREGVYPPGIVADVPESRLNKFFTEEDGFFKVKRSLRECVIFAEHSVFRDTPFSRLDLISCRNLLIYLQPELQRKTLALFHYALKPSGFLFLGNSESVSANEELFQAVNKSGSLFQKVESPSQRTPLLAPVASKQSSKNSQDTLPKTLKQVVEQELLAHHCPTAVVLDRNGEILYVHGQTAPFLKPLEGTTDLHVLNMIRGELKSELVKLLSEVRRLKQTAISPTIALLICGKTSRVSLLAEPFKEASAITAPQLLVVFREEQSEEDTLDSIESAEVLSKDPQYAEIEKELWSTRQYLKRTIQQLERTNEEVRCTNEELQSANEELQSTNEELETSREELQSVNEELTTLNSELQTRIEESSLINDDLNNLLSSIEVAVVFLDNSLRVTRYTPAVTQILPLLPSDKGRFFGDINSGLEIRQSDLLEHAETVLRELSPFSCEMRSLKGCWYTLSIIPYRRSDNAIEGVVLTFLDITSQKKVQESLQLPSMAVEESPAAMALTDPSGVVRYANRAGHEFFPVGSVLSFLEKASTDFWPTIHAGGTWKSGTAEGEDLAGEASYLQVRPLGKPGALEGLVAVRLAGP